MSSASYGYSTLASYADYLVPVLPGESSYLDTLTLSGKQTALNILREGMSAPVPQEWEHIRVGTPSESWYNHVTGVVQVAHPVDEATRSRLLALKTLEYRPPSPVRLPSTSPVAQRLQEAVLQAEALEHAREVESLRAAHRKALATLNSEAESMLLKAEQDHAATLRALQEEHRGVIESLRASHNSTIESLSAGHAAAAARLEGSMHTLRELERERNNELDAAASSREEAARLRIKADADSKAVKEAADAVEQAVGEVEQAVHSYVTQKLASPSGGSGGGSGGSSDSAIPGLMPPPLPVSIGGNTSIPSARFTPAGSSSPTIPPPLPSTFTANQHTLDVGRRVLNVSRALPRPMPSPPRSPTSLTTTYLTVPPNRGPMWYAARADEELARCGLFEDGLELQRGELAASRESLGEEYKRFKSEVDEMAGLQGTATTGATVRARQAVLRLTKVNLEGRIKAQNDDIEAWNKAADFARERWAEARALAREACAPRYSEEACRAIEERLRAMDTMEVAGAAKMAYLRGIK